MVLFHTGGEVACRSEVPALDIRQGLFKFLSTDNGNFSKPTRDDLYRTIQRGIEIRRGCTPNFSARITRASITEVREPASVASVRMSRKGTLDTSRMLRTGP